MRVRGFSIVAGLSLLLFVAVCVLWVRSYAVEYSVFWARDRKTYHVLSLDGRIGVRVLPWGMPGPPRFMSFTRAQLSAYRVDRWAGPSFVGFHLKWEKPEQTWREPLGFPGGGSKSVAPRPHVVVGVPYYAIALVPALWSAGRTIHFAKRLKRARHGLCPSCGYDLRATPGKCPECGEVTAEVSS